jgi:hypothetical protein
MKILRGFVAAVVAIVATFVLSYGTDYILRGLGLLPQRDLYVSWLIILVVIFYRSIYSAVGSYIAARLAPKRPMTFALGLGIFGFVGSILVTVATWNMHLGPHWYGFVLAAFALPSAWLGGRLAAKSEKQYSTEGLWRVPRRRFIRNLVKKNRSRTLA